MMEYGLIGEKLGHSFSKIIHEKIADYTYELKEISKENLDSFMKLFIASFVIMIMSLMK